MRWRGRRQSKNVRDLRGTRTLSNRRNVRLPQSRGVRRASGGSSLGLIVVGLILYFVFGINPLTLLNSGSVSSFQQPQTQMQSSSAMNNDEMTQFVRTILADTEVIWTEIFKQKGQDYPLPTMTLFSNQVRSACGFASSASGPFYCPADSNIYIDLNFYQELARRFEAPGDFAQAYVLAHEVGHHVQNVIGVLPQFNRARRSMTKRQENAASIRVELQADCFAGIWAHYTARNNWIEYGDLEEALNAAMQIGDDAIQRRVQGYVVPESFNHGTSEQRQKWFKRGFDLGEIEACDTFSTKDL